MTIASRPMQDSGAAWLGQIPSSWQTLKGKALFQQRNEKGNPSGELLAATQTNGMFPQRLLEGVVRVKEDTDLQSFKTVRCGDFVISLRSFQGGFEISDYEGVCSPAYQVFYGRAPLENRYFKYLFKDSRFIAAMDSMTVGIREGKNIRYSDFANSLLPVPPLEEQERIADFLDEECGKIDSVKQTLVEEIEALKRLRKATIHQAVTKGLDPTAPMKPSGIPWIGEMPAEWTLCKQKHVFALVNGRAYANEEFEQEGKYRILRVGNLFSNPVWYSSSMELEPDKYCNDGDLLYSWSMSYGPHIWRGDKVIFHYHIWKVSLSGNVEKLYAYYYLMALTEAIRSEVHETTMSFVTMQSMNNSYIAFPTRTEQQRIVDYLDERCAAIDSVIDTRTKQLERLEDYRKALIFAYVTGKKEINRG